MIKSFMAVVLFFVLALASVVGHMLFYKSDEHTAKVQAVSRLITLPTLAFSTAYFSSNIHHYNLSSNPAYPELIAIDTLDFVYVK